MTEKDVLIALQEAYRQSGTQVALAQKAGVSQGRIADYLNGRCSIGNMTIATLLRLFPEMSIDFFGGTSGNMASDGMRSLLLEIFESLDGREQARLLAMVAANFGDKLREETK